MIGDARDERLERRNRRYRRRRPGDRYFPGLEPSDWPTRDELADMFAPAILAACRSVLNTSSPARALGDLCTDDRAPGRRGRKPRVPPPPRRPRPMPARLAPAPLEPLTPARDVATPPEWTPPRAVNVNITWLATGRFL